MSVHATKQAPMDDGEFAARIFLIGGPPDGDGDVIDADATQARQEVDVSLQEHDVLRAGAEPAGRATLFSTGRAVLAHGKAHASDRGRQLRTRLLERGPDTMWSVGYFTSPDVFVSRPPNTQELKVWPDARRVITKWFPFEISPVRFGSCGPACRTLSAKCASPCSCTPRAPALEPADLKRFARAQAYADASKERWGLAAINAADTCAQWATGGREQTGPIVKWFDPDGRRDGFWDPADPDAIYISRGMSPEETISTIAHEVEHWLRPYDPDESRAERAADRFVWRYLATREGCLW